MTELRTELTDLATAREQVSSIATTLSNEQKKLTASLHEFLGTGWTGRAASEFAAGWSEWNTAAGEILDGLHAMSRLLEAARVDYVTTDDGEHSDLVRLTVRLGPQE